FALDLDLDLGSGLAGDEVGRIRGRHSLGRCDFRLGQGFTLAVDLADDVGDHVASLDPGFVSRAVLDRGNDLQISVGARIDGDTDVCKVAGGVGAEAIDGVRVDIGRVRIEMSRHPLQRDVNVLVLVEIFTQAEPFADVGKQLDELRLLHGLD